MGNKNRPSKESWENVQSTNIRVLLISSVHFRCAPSETNYFPLINLISRSIHYGGLILNRIRRVFSLFAYAPQTNPERRRVKRNSNIHTKERCVCRSVSSAATLKSHSETSTDAWSHHKPRIPRKRNFLKRDSSVRASLSSTRDGRQLASQIISN